MFELNKCILSEYGTIVGIGCDWRLVFACL